MIAITETYIEKYLKSLLQKNLLFKIKGKSWHTGRLILFKQSGFYIELNLQSKNKIKFEIPIPFNIEDKKESLLFDYRISTLVNKDKKLLELIDKINISTKNKFYNTILEINII